MTKNIILQTKRLNITVPDKTSLDNRYKLLSDPEVIRYIGNGNAKTKEEIKDFLQKNIEHYQKYKFCLFDIFTKQTEEFVGDAGLIYEALNPKNQNVEVGYRLHKKYWNKGYATELTKTFIQWGFTRLRLAKIIAYCKPDNIASSNVMKKCDMKYKGKYLYNGENECDIYQITN